jgi:hypothetical protein
MMSMRLEGNKVPIEVGTTRHKIEGRVRALALNRESKYIPILRAFCSRALEIFDVTVSRERFIHFLAGETGSYRKPGIPVPLSYTLTQDSYEFLAERYDCLPSDLRALEAEIASMEMNTLLIHPLWDVLVKTDN